MTPSKTRTLFLVSAAALPVFCLVLTGSFLEARQRAKSTIYPTTATFGAGGIHDEGQGPYYDRVDGVSSYRVAGSGTTNGWAWDLAGRTKTPRSLVYDLTNPADPASPSQGVIAIINTHGQVYDLSSMALGEVRYVRAAFHLIIDRVDYVLRFGQSSTDGSSALEVTRISASEFHVTTGAQGDVARFLRGNGPGEVLLGYYHLPLALTLTDQ